MKHREMHFQTTGTIMYDPLRGMDKNGKPIVDTGRVVIQIPSFGLIDYYAFQFKKKFGIQLTRPSWEPHITVFANHRFSRNKKAPWGYRNKEKVVIYYSHNMFWNDEHVWVSADCEATEDIRNHYQNDPMDRGHITIGRFHPSDIGKLPNFKKFEDGNLWDSYIFNKPI